MCLALSAPWCLAGAAPAPARSPAAAPAKSKSARRDASTARSLLDKARNAAHHKQYDAAYLWAKQAADLQPDNLELRVVRLTLQQKAVLAHLQRAYAFARQRNDFEAGIAFRSALAIDPDNEAARHGLSELAQSMTATGARRTPTEMQLRVQGAAPPAQPEPASGRHDFHLLDGTRAIIGQVVGAYGLKTYVENDTPDRRIRFDLTGATFAQAMRVLHDTLHVSWIALDAHTLYFGPDAEAVHFRHLGERTFYLAWVSDPKEITELTQVLRTALNLQYVYPNAADHAITVRATPDLLDAAERLLLNFRHAPGDVMLDVRILEVTRSTSNKLGIGEPNHFQLFTLAPLLRQLAQQSPDLQQQILQLFEQGGLNAVLQSGQLSSLLAQLGQTQNPLNSLLQNPFAVFGGGATLMALTVPALTADLARQESAGRMLEDAWLHASNDQAATLKIGSRYPITNATFSPIMLNPAISKVIGNGSYLQPFPSFTYEDLGLDLKLTPHLQSDQSIGLKVEAQARALTGASNDGVPIISNRKLVTQLSLKNGESAILAGLFDKQETRSLAGLPFLGQVPGLGQLFSTLNNSQTNEQLLILVTPHILQHRNPQTAEIWLPPGLVSTATLPPLALPSESTPEESKPGEMEPEHPEREQRTPEQRPAMPPPPSGMAPNRIPAQLPGQPPAAE